MMDGPYPSIGLRTSQHDYSHLASGLVQPRASFYSSQRFPAGQYHESREEILAHAPEEGNRPTADVSSWGLPDHLLSPDIESAIQSPLDHHINADTIPSSSYPRPSLPLQTAELLTPEPVTSPLQSRAASIHLNLVDDRRSIAPTLRSNAESVEYLGEGNDDTIDAVLRQSERIRILAEEAMKSPRMIPLPPSPATTLQTFTSRPVSSLSTRHTSAPSLSALTDDIDEVDGSNPFALPPPPAALGSRFDPKLARDQGGSVGTRPFASGSRVSFAEPRSTMERRRSSLGKMEDLDTDFGPPQYPRRMSASSAQTLKGKVDETGRPASKVWTDIPTAKQFGRPLMPNRYSTMSNLSSLRSQRALTLRPQTLYMPRPLSGMLPPPSPPRNIPDGYTLGEKPLPPGSRSSILSLANPRPGIPMSLSQRTFRNSLMVDGKRDGPVYTGDVSPEGPFEELPDVGGEDGGVVEEEEERRPGKLYGTSLMDQLEARKAAQRSKQRVFTGDSRPAMMARSSLIQPWSPNNAPVDPPPGQDLEDPTQRHTLVHVPSNDALNSTGTRDRITKSTSVFGVDQIWEKELAKLKLRGEEEARMEAEQAARDALEGRKKGKKAKGKAKVLPVEKDLELPVQPAGLTPTASPARPQHDLGLGLPISPIKRLPDGPPRLSYSPAKVPPTVIPHLVQERQRAVSSHKDGWSSDEDNEGNTAPKQASRTMSTAAQTGSRIDDRVDDSDSDEDVPLSKLVISGPTPANAPRGLTDDDSDEDVPLSKLATNKSISSRQSAGGSKRVSSMEASPTLDLDTAAFGSGSLGLDIPGVTSPTAGKTASPADADEDDDVPLALCRPTPNPEDAEDDVPLGYKHPAAAGQDRGSFYSMVVPGMSTFPSMQWGMAGYPSFPNLSPYGYPPGQVQYPFSSMPSMPQMAPYYPPNPYQHQPYGRPETIHGYGVPPPGWEGVQPMAQQQTTVRKIDSWRKEVAVAPAGSSSGSVSLGRRSGGAVI